MTRGLEERHEHAARMVARDTRPLGIRFAEAISNPSTLIAFIGGAAAILVMYPLATDIAALIIGLLYLFAVTRKTTLPFRMPKSSGMKDYNDLKPGSTKPKNAGGISFFGNDRVTMEELWFNNEDLRTHVLIFGSTGSGKTEALVSIAYNSLLQGSGYIYIDGKGDNSLFAKMFSMVRSMGREDDILLINFMTGARDVLGPQKNRLSNTMNPFAFGSSSMLAQLIISLMDQSSSGSGGDMWKGRAMSFVESLMRILTAMRDAKHILLDANTIRDYFMLEKLEQIVLDKQFPLEDGTLIPLEEYPPQATEPLKNYLNTLPGFNVENKGNQAGEVREQHGFITMQLTRVFGSLADTYGHIIRTNLAEVDFKDVVLNRRILIVLLPALEKSPEELAALGKVIVASLKAMMAAGLGDAVEGDYRDVILSKPTTSPSPYTCIMDEYGYYAVPGFAVVPAQARSLGFSAVFAGQDLPAFEKASKEEAASICANTNIKICMKLEDPQATWEFFNKAAGETYVTNVSGFQMNANSMALNYMDTRSASVDRRQRIELLDLKDQREGEMHVFFKSKIVRAEVFFANPKPVKRMRINHHLKIEPPSDAMLINLDQRLRQFKQTLEKVDAPLPEPPFNEDIRIIAESLDEAENLNYVERGVSALISLLENEVQRQTELNAPYEHSDPEDHISAFTRVPISAIVKEMIGQENTDFFSLPLLRKGGTLEELKHIERLCGRDSAEAERLAGNLVADIEKATEFPPPIEFARDVNQTLQDISDVIEMFGGEALDIQNLPTTRIDDSEPEEDFGQHEVLMPDEMELPSFETEDETEDVFDLPEEDELTAKEDLETFAENLDFPLLPELPDLPDAKELDEILKDPSYKELLDNTEEENDDDEDFDSYFDEDDEDND